MRQTPDKMRAWLTLLRKKMNLKSLVVTLAAIVVFTTTYLLILPAFTLDKDEAVQQGGIDVVAEETAAMETDSETVESSESKDSKDSEVVTTDIKDEKSDEQAKDAESKKESKAADQKNSQSTGGALQAEGDGFTVSATPAGKSDVPDTAELQVEELKSTDKELKDYREEALEALKKDSDDVKGIKEIKVYDMSLESDGKAVDTNAKFNVKIEYEDGVTVEDADNVRVLTFDDKKKAEVLDAKENKVETKVEETGKKSNVTEASFETEGISKVAVVEVETIEKTVITADGNTYKVTVKYDKNAQIPDGATLDVKELTGDEYDAYLEKTADKLDKSADDLGMAKFFDITIKNGDEEVKIANPVDVEIKLLDSELADDTQVLHFANENKADVVDSTVSGDTVKFEAEGFSVYAIIDSDDQSEPETYSAKYTFKVPTYTESGDDIVVSDTDYVDYEFVNKEGDKTSVQYVPNGGYLENPGTPVGVIPADKKEFLGWWTKTAEGNWDKKVDFSEAVSVNDEHEEHVVYARYAHTLYITYMDEANTVYMVDKRASGDNVITSKDGHSEDDLTNNKYMSYQPKSQYQAFIGWSKTHKANSSLGTSVDPDFTLDKSVTLYPVLADVRWLTYKSGPTGSNATYFAAEYMLDGNWTKTSLSDKVPTRPGYTFDGWYVRNEETQGADNALNFIWEIGSSDVKVADQNGAFDNSFLNSTDYFETVEGQKRLKDNLTIVAHWVPAEVDYVYVYWQQVAEPDENGNYPYVYKDSRSAKGYSESMTANPPKPEWSDVDCFTLHEGTTTDETGSVVPDKYTYQPKKIEGDGSTIVNVYYDRNEYTITFLEQRSGSGYVISDNATNNVYGIINGEYKQLTRESKTETRYVLSQNNSGSTEYTGTIYSDKYGTVATNPTYGDGKTYYRRSSWGNYYELYWRPQTTTVYTWKVAETGEPYTGTRFTYVTNGRNQWFVIDELTISAKYGQNVSDLWPDKRNEELGTNYPQTWSTSQSADVGQSGIQNMPPNNASFYNNFSTSIESYYYYYLQDLPAEHNSIAPNRFTLVRSDATPFGWTTWDDYSIYEGFLINANNQNDANTLNTENNAVVATTDRNYSRSTNIGGNVSTQNPANFYYLRQQYSISFQQENTVLGTATRYFEENLEGADKDSSGKDYSTMVTLQPGEYFDGWYDNADCLGDPYNLDGTMPANNIILYAKISREEFEVDLDFNGAVTREANDESTYFWVDYGETIKEYEEVTRDYVKYNPANPAHVGKQRYDYIHWKYREYTDSEGEEHWEAYYIDKNGVEHVSEYGADGTRSASYVESDDGEFVYSPGVYTFIGWYETDENGNLLSNVAHNFTEPITKHTYLKAMFRREGTFHVRYLRNMGAEGEENFVAGDSSLPAVGGNDEVVYQDEYTYVDLSDAKITHDIKADEDKYVFKGWRVKGTNGPLYQPGDTFQIDSDYVHADGNLDFIELEPVFDQIGVTSITYVLNKPAEAPQAAVQSDVLTDPSGIDENTQSGLKINNEVTLSDGSGFSIKGYRLVGWSNKPDVTDEDAIKYDLAGKYGVSDESNDTLHNPLGNTLYAVWEKVSTVDLVVKKTDDAASPSYLNGASFVFKLGNTGIAPEDVQPNADNSYTMSNGESGLTYRNLEIDNTYNLTEVGAPDGYVIEDTDISIEFTDDDIEVSGANVVLVTDSDGKAHTTTSESGNTVYYINVTNKAGTPLPHTGGIGTTLFYIIGSILVIVCGIVLVSRRRMGSNK